MNEEHHPRPESEGAKLNIQWYPGHMVKAKRLVQEHLKLVDVVIELVDARLPMSSRNPDIDPIIGNKPRLLVLNKADLADSQVCREWIKQFKTMTLEAVLVNSINGQGLAQVTATARRLAADKLAAMQAKGMRPRAVRAMIVGIPNVGKSSFINKLAGKATAKTGDKPGVTKGKQWIKVGKDFELLDTPGILWPKFEDPEVGLKLAFTGAISDITMDIEELVVRLLERLAAIAPQKVQERYKLPDLPDDANQLLEAIGAKRGCLRQGAVVDRLKAAQIVLDEFRSGKLGLFTLDEPAQ
ncbi:MAG: ribosome biogenesis GTPase YlqF [Clostridia bacterium]|nr:ribosome biogenesis GTPase YlqF [Clostridia bacterium]